MKVGIGLPNNTPGVKGSVFLEWARRVDQAPFSSLCVIDRLVYNTHECLITLTAAAAVTHRVRLMTTVLVAPLRNAALLAKQAATLDSLSGGRLTLGLGVSRREDDYRASSVPFRQRGKIFEEQLALMRRIWSAPSGPERSPFLGLPSPSWQGGGSMDPGPIGPIPLQRGGPELLIGGSAPAALARVGRWADGYIAVSGDPPTVQNLFRIVEEGWKAARRPGRPRFVGGVYFALGRSPAERGVSFLRDYYAGRGPVTERLVRSLVSSPELVRETIDAFSAVGMDELVFWPTVADLDQVDRLAGAVG